MSTRYRIVFHYQEEEHSREIGWLYLKSMLSWVLDQEGCELLSVEVTETEEEAAQ